MLSSFSASAVGAPFSSQNPPRVGDRVHALLGSSYWANGAGRVVAVHPGLVPPIEVAWDAPVVHNPKKPVEVKRLVVASAIFARVEDEAAGQSDPPATNEPEAEDDCSVESIRAMGHVVTDCGYILTGNGKPEPKLGDRVRVEKTGNKRRSEWKFIDSIDREIGRATLSKTPPQCVLDAKKLPALRKRVEKLNREIAEIEERQRLQKIADAPKVRGHLALLPPVEAKQPEPVAASNVVPIFDKGTMLLHDVQRAAQRIVAESQAAVGSFSKPPEPEAEPVRDEDPLQPVRLKGGVVEPAIIPPGLTPHEVAAMLREVGYVVSDEWMICGYRNSTSVGDCVSIASTDRHEKKRLSHLYIETIDENNLATFTKKRVSAPKSDKRERAKWNLA